ncbi:MAG: hypothetical protein M1837_001122 [Sclerophora amabilis]|nr:MAG: hypothetical protein M1837_001122 [Sclerophora amabilis]
MAPTRRYLRISKFSVLECRIYLDNPALANSWLLHPRNPVLPRIIERIKPLVLPKLRDERERQKKGKGGRKAKVFKDVIVEDDYEVSVFFKDRKLTSYSLLTKQKIFREPGKKISTATTSGKMIGAGGASTDRPIQLEEEDESEDVQAHPPVPGLLREEEDEDENRLALRDIPTAEDDSDAQNSGSSRRSRRRRNDGENDEGTLDAIQSSGDSATSETRGTAPPRKRRRKQVDRNEQAEAAGEESDGHDDKKKLSLNTSYDGFRIYGLTLCMVVHRRQDITKEREGGKGNSVGRSMMEGWITSTSADLEEEEES